MLQLRPSKDTCTECPFSADLVLNAKLDERVKEHIRSRTITASDLNLIVSFSSSFPVFGDVVGGAGVKPVVSCCFAFIHFAAHSATSSI